MVTLFGDVVTQHGGWISSGSLVETFAAFGYSERSVRSAVYRLAQEDWITGKKMGRKSYCSITQSATKQFQKAAKRIYARQAPPQDDGWLLLMPSFVSDAKLPQLKRQLKWLGFSRLTSGVYAHPQCAQQQLEETLDELKLKKSVVIFSAQSLDACSEQLLKKLVYEKWQLKKIAKSYQSFITIYQKLMAKDPCHTIKAQSALMLRLLLIHEYRRIILKDHQLACNMLPVDWPAATARELTANLYLDLVPASSDYIQQSLQRMDGHLPPADAQFFYRFQCD